MFSDFDFVAPFWLFSLSISFISIVFVFAEIQGNFPSSRIGMNTKISSMMRFLFLFNQGLTNNLPSSTINLQSLHHHYQQIVWIGGELKWFFCCSFHIATSFHINKPYGTNFPHHHSTQIDFKFIQNTIHTRLLMLMFLFLPR